MSKNRKCVAIIPARGGSKEIPYKNIVNLNRKPLIAYTIEAAKGSGLFDKIVVSTDSERVGRLSIRYGAQVVKRPKRLAKDRTPTEPVMLHALEWLKRNEDYRPEIIVLLQPTSPLRGSRDIRRSYMKFIKERLDSLLSVTLNKIFIWKKVGKIFKAINYNYQHRPRRQDIKDQFKENGAIYITKYSVFTKLKNRLGGKIGYYLMDKDISIEIDSPFDLIAARQALKREETDEKGY